MWHVASRDPCECLVPSAAHDLSSITLSPFAEKETEAEESRAHLRAAGSGRGSPGFTLHQETVTPPQSIRGLLGKALNRKNGGCCCFCFLE